MSRGQDRAARLNEMKRLYVQQAFTDIEMAQRLEVDRTTVFKDRGVLETEYPFVEVVSGRYKIDKSRLLSEVHLSVHEALPVYLAARRISRQTRMAQKHLASAVEKLAQCLHQPMTERLVAAANTVLHQETNPTRISVLEGVADSWVEQREARITYRALRARRPLIHVIRPYLIEPSLWGDGAYVIAHTNVMDSVVPFKIERIEDVVLTGQQFEIPEDFDENELLQYAWGIWLSDNEPVTVRLRFAPGEVTRRVQETIWHPSQKIDLLEDGGCEWSAEVAEWQEMVPFVRGWGAACEVIEPQAMRVELMREARKLAALYGVTNATSPEEEDFDDHRMREMMGGL